MKKKKYFRSKSILLLLTLTISSQWGAGFYPMPIRAQEEMSSDEDNTHSIEEMNSQEELFDSNPEEVDQAPLHDSTLFNSEEAEEMPAQAPLHDPDQSMESGQTYGDKENPRPSETTLDGIDISNWQSGIDLDKIEADFVILKASGGKSFKDKSFHRFAKQTLESGRLLGFYHFASDFGHEGTPEEEADFFFHQVESYIGKGIPILDYEQSDLLRSGSDWAFRFLQRFYDLSGVRCMLYTSSYFSRSIDWKQVADAGYPLWVACYGKNEVQEGYRPTEETKTDGFGTGAFKTYYMHQYSSQGRLEGYGSNLDLNKFYGTKADWQKLCLPDPVNRPMYRVYNYYSGEHFYTGSKSEYTQLILAGWKDESIAWISPKEGKNVYRLLNPNTGDHHYTMDVNERDTIIGMGWIYEGIGWVSEEDSNKGYSIYRLYNPNAETGTHHYTSDLNEIRELVAWGWEFEDIAWYGLDLEKAVQDIQVKADEPISLKQETIGLLSKY